MTAADDLSFADRLRALADLYDRTPDLPEPTSVVRLYVSGYGANAEQQARAGLAAARRVGPQTPPVIGDFYVETDLAGGVVLAISKELVGSRRRVTREVEEFVLDPEPGTTSDEDRAAAAAVNALHSVSV